MDVATLFLAAPIAGRATLDETTAAGLRPGRRPAPDPAPDPAATPGPWRLPRRRGPANTATPPTSATEPRRRARVA